jgi:NRPS condensation-like uncharacterized protein
MSKNDILKSTPTERMQVLYRRRHKPLIRLFLRFSGAIDEAALKGAVDGSLKAAPLVSCAYDFRHHRWAKKNFTGQDIVSEIPAADDSLENLTPAMLSDLDLSAGPQLRVFLFRGEAGDSLCFLSSHLAFDGTSLKRYAYLLAKLYSALLSGTGEDAAEGYSLDRGFFQVLKTLPFRKRLSLLIPPKNPEKSSLFLPFSGMEKEQFIVLETIDETCFPIAAAEAKALGATVNDLVMTAYARALGKLLGLSDIILPCPVSFLSKLPNPDKSAFFNLTGYYHFILHLEAGEDFAASLGKATLRMEAEKKSLNSFKGPFLLGKAYAWFPNPLAEKIVYKIAPPPIVSYTNIGIINGDDLAFGDVVPDEAYFVTTVKKAPSFQLTVSTYDDVLYLSSAFDGNESDRTLISRLLESVKNEISAFAGIEGS